MLHPLTLGIALLAAGAPAPALTLVRDGQAKAVLVLPNNASPAAVEGARILGDHLFQMSGARLPVRKESELPPMAAEGGRLTVLTGPEPPEAYVLIGEGDLARRLGVTAEGLGPGGIRIQTTANALVLLGPDERTPSDPWGTRYAVTTFLEDALGCRFLWPGELGKVVPRRRSVTVPALDVRFTPLLRQRKIRDHHYNDRMQTGLERLGFTKEDYERGRAAAEKTEAASGTWFGWQRLGGTLGLASGHAFGHLWERYGKAHPEWFALQPDGSRDQSRAPTRPRLCKSNPELIEAIVREKIEEIRRRPDTRSVSVGPNDGGGTTFCTCPNCKALDPPEGRRITLLDATKNPRREFEYVSLTDRMVFLWNAIAEGVTKAYPDVLLTADAYSAYSAPPLKRTLHPNLVIRFVPISYASDEARRQGRADWDAWAARASKIYFRPNLLLFAYREGITGVYVHKLAEDFGYLAHHSMIGTDFDSCLHNWATQGLNYYVLARLHWNPDADVDALVEDYCRSGFGPAAAPIRRYFDAVERLTDQTAARGVRGKDLGVTDAYTPEAVTGLRGYLDAADQAAGGDETIRRRIVFLRRGLELTDLQAQVYRLLTEAEEKGAVPDKAEAARLLDRKFAMMRSIFARDPLVVSVAHLCWGEWGRFRALGWDGPTGKTVIEADEEGRPVEAPGR